MPTSVVARDRVEGEKIVSFTVDEGYFYRFGT